MPKAAHQCLDASDNLQSVTSTLAEDQSGRCEAIDASECLEINCCSPNKVDAKRQVTIYRGKFFVLNDPMNSRCFNRTTPLADQPVYQKLTELSSAILDEKTGLQKYIKWTWGKVSAVGTMTFFYNVIKHLFSLFLLM